MSVNPLIAAAERYRAARRRAYMRGYREMLLPDRYVWQLRASAACEERRERYRALDSNGRLQRDVIRAERIFRDGVMRELTGPFKTWLFSDPLREINCRCVPLGALYAEEELRAARRRDELDEEITALLAADEAVVRRNAEATAGRSVDATSGAAHPATAGRPADNSSSQDDSLWRRISEFARSRCRDARDTSALLDHLGRRLDRSDITAATIRSWSFSDSADPIEAEIDYEAGQLATCATRFDAPFEERDDARDPRSPLERLLSDAVRAYDYELCRRVERLSRWARCQHYINYYVAFYGIVQDRCSLFGGTTTAGNGDGDDGDGNSGDELDASFHVLRMPDLAAASVLKLWRALPMRAFSRLMRHVWFVLPPFSRVRYGDYNNLTMCHYVNCRHGWNWDLPYADSVGRENEFPDDDCDGYDDARDVCSNPFRFVECEKRLAIVASARRRGARCGGAVFDSRPSLLPAVRAMRDYGDWNVACFLTVLSERLLADIDDFARLDAAGEAEARWAEWRVLCCDAQACEVQYVSAILHPFLRADELAEVYRSAPVYKRNVTRYLFDWAYVDCARGGLVIPDREVLYDSMVSLARLQVDLNLIVAGAGLDDAADPDLDVRVACALGLVPPPESSETTPPAPPTRRGDRHCFTLRQLSLRRVFETFALSDHALLRFAPYREYARRVVARTRDYYISTTLRNGGFSCEDMLADTRRRRYGYDYAVLDLQVAITAARERRRRNGGADDRDGEEHDEWNDDDEDDDGSPEKRDCWPAFLVDDMWRNESWQ